MIQIHPGHMLYMTEQRNRQETWNKTDETLCKAQVIPCDRYGTCSVTSTSRRPGCTYLMVPRKTREVARMDLRQDQAALAGPYSSRIAYNLSLNVWSSRPTSNGLARASRLLPKKGDRTPSLHKAQSPPRFSYTPPDRTC